MSADVWVIVFGVVIWAISVGIKLRKQRDAEDATFAGEHQGWDIYKSAYNRGVLALDHANRRIAIGTVSNHIERPWSDISAVEVEKNGQSIIQTNRGSQVMGAAVGAVLLGPLGLLMGGMSGSKRQRERINELSLKVLIDDRAAPVHRITFFRMAGDGVDAQSSTLKVPASQMEQFQALLANAIRSDNRSFAKQPIAAAIAEASNSDRIAKLWELKQAGALTAEEFESEKRAVLSGGWAPSAQAITARDGAGSAA
ncbi:SHOCT domain-containing protein [Sphingomonas aerophila]|uniref:SHOCT domain-containing protein n=1 Tax=Sphingomonas aerophila TaxID=1344948 RepID=A0A7W9EV33_9SPHN|nr:SHOCT domain-containing protein [Sphingomonas aerophila]MBB5715836.1 hypothetical protein [Sphingomonas aerophila]